MARYLLLLRFTQKGIETIRESPSRVEAAKGLAKELGAEVKDFYALLGPYDTCLILEAPNDETATKYSLSLCAKGNVRSETLRAFSESEYRSLVGGVR
ncbi:MAG: GYD domain-containing protein [Myxococcales bacterium]|nr:GYD domain-containing protein [Myxococcales bacterium]